MPLQCTLDSPEETYESVSAKLDALVNPSVYQQHTVFIRLPAQDDDDEPPPLVSESEEESTPSSIGSNHHANFTPYIPGDGTILDDYLAAEQDLPELPTYAVEGSPQPIVDVRHRPFYADTREYRAIHTSASTRLRAYDRLDAIRRIPVPALFSSSASELNTAMLEYEQAIDHAYQSWFDFMRRGAAMPLAPMCTTVV